MAAIIIAGAAKVATTIAGLANAGGLVGAATRFAISAGLSAASQALARRAALKQRGGVQMQRQIGPLVARQIAVGGPMVAGSEVALWASGDADDNRFNTRVIVFSDWPAPLEALYWRGQALTFDGDLTTGWRACNQFRGKKNRARLWARWYSGDWEQTADSTLISAATASAPWTSADRLRGCAYLALRREYDPDAFPQGPPDADGLRAKLAPCVAFDWRDNTQSLTDARTWKPTRNPVVLAEFGLCHARAPAQFSPGDTGPLVGPGLDWSRRFAALGGRLTAFANLCDELVGGVPRWQVAGVMEGPATNWMGQLASACGGEWIQTAAGSLLRPGHVSAPVMDLPLGAVSGADGETYDPWPAPDSGINTVRGQYPEPASGYELASVDAVHAAARAADGRDLVETIDLSWCPTREQANRVVQARARLAGVRGRREIVGPFWAGILERGDTITLEDPTLPSALAGAWWQVESVAQAATEEGARASLALRQVPSDAWGTPPPAPPAPPFQPPSLARALAAPPVTATLSTVSGGGASWQELVFALADTSGQPLGLVQLQGPAAASDSTSLDAAKLVSIPLDRAMGAVSSGLLAAGWYRWRAAGVAAGGAVGDWSAWSAALQATGNLTAGGITIGNSSAGFLTLPDGGYLTLPDGGYLSLPGTARPDEGTPGQLWTDGITVWRADDAGDWQTLSSQDFSQITGDTKPQDNATRGSFRGVFATASEATIAGVADGDTWRSNATGLTYGRFGGVDTALADTGLIVALSAYVLQASGVTNVETASVTASTTGASGAVTWQWVKLSGPSSHVAVTPTAATTIFRRTGTMPAGASETSGWQVVATDAAGRTASIALGITFDSTA